MHCPICEVFDGSQSYVEAGESICSSCQGQISGLDRLTNGMFTKPVKQGMFGPPATLRGMRYDHRMAVACHLGYLSDPISESVYRILASKVSDSAKALMRSSVHFSKVDQTDTNSVSIPMGARGRNQLLVRTDADTITFTTNRVTVCINRTTGETVSASGDYPSISATLEFAAQALEQL